MSTAWRATGPDDPLARGVASAGDPPPEVTLVVEVFATSAEHVRVRASYAGDPDAAAPLLQAASDAIRRLAERR